MSDVGRAELARERPSVWVSLPAVGRGDPSIGSRKVSSYQGPAILSLQLMGEERDEQA